MLTCRPLKTFGGLQSKQKKFEAQLLKSYDKQEGENLFPNQLLLNEGMMQQGETCPSSSFLLCFGIKLKWNYMLKMYDSQIDWHTYLLAFVIFVFKYIV